MKKNQFRNQFKESKESDVQRNQKESNRNTLLEAECEIGNQITFESVEAVASEWANLVAALSSVLALADGEWALVNVALEKNVYLGGASTDFIYGGI